MSVSNARKLLRAADAEPVRIRRHLLVAAGLREALTHEPIVVGGTAEEFWTRAGYHETDVDLCGRITPKDKDVLRELGFHREGRHWVRDSRHPVAVEFPDSELDGDLGRTVEKRVASGIARLIGLDDLYVDRLRQATVDEQTEGVEFHSALAIAAARFEEMDWRYIQRRIRDERTAQPMVGESMSRLNRRIRARVRRELARVE